MYRARYQLPAPLKDPAFAGLGAGRFALLGGLDSSEVSSAGIEIADGSGVLHTASLPLAQHDAQAAELGGEVYVFGGGSSTELDHIVSFDPARRVVSTVGTLPRAQSDVAVTATGGTAYVVGGYDGTNWLNTILAWRPGSPVRVVARLPVGLRYAAATAVGGQILVIGGSTPRPRATRSTGSTRAPGTSARSAGYPTRSHTPPRQRSGRSRTSSAAAGTISDLKPRACGRSIRAPARSRSRGDYPSPYPTPPRFRSTGRSSSPADSRPTTP